MVVGHLPQIAGAFFYIFAANKNHKKIDMKFKHLLALVLLLSLTSGLLAKPVEIREAERVAKNFIYITLNKYQGNVSFADIRLYEPFVYKTNGSPVFYAFQMKPGFIIISADDAYTPVIGYSFEGEFIFDESPAHYKGFILNYAEQIDYIRENQVSPLPEFEAAWNELRQENVTNVSFNRDRDVTPLLQHNWDQGSPYNILCPEDPDGPGGHVWVGCVATAMAQIMFYWRYPEVGTGQHCYIPGNMSYGQQCAYYGQTHYEWEGMNNSIDNKNPFPNAELQYHCAVSVNMNFSPDGSGSYSYLVPGSLNSYFQYNSAQYKEKQNYTLANWIALLKADLDQGYPIYYSGYNPTQGGHAFVCDGYQGDNFHFNFGWSGSGNGYYSLSDVGGFYQGQACVRNFIPTSSDYPYYVTDTIYTVKRSGSLTDGSGPVENYLDNNTGYWLIDPQTVEDSITDITLSFTQFDLLAGDTLKIYDGESIEAPLLGAFSGTEIPAPVSSNQNKMLLVFSTNASGNASGWFAQYTSTSPTWCSGMTQLTEPSGNFNDGSGNFYYQGGATCMWRIKPEFAGKVTLYFNSFETEEGIDKMKIYDNTTLIGEYSGSTLPDPVEAMSGTMFITWSTNQSTNFQGWDAYYEIDNVGIDENSGISGLETYPNPATESLNVSFAVKESQNINLRIISLTGQVVYSEAQPGFEGTYFSSIGTGNYPAGIYFLEISSDSGKSVKKIVVR